MTMSTMSMARVFSIQELSDLIFQHLGSRSITSMRQVSTLFRDFCAPYFAIAIPSHHFSSSRVAYPPRSLLDTSGHCVTSISFQQALPPDWPSLTTVLQLCPYVESLHIATLCYNLNFLHLFPPPDPTGASRQRRRGLRALSLDITGETQSKLDGFLTALGHSAVALTLQTLAIKDTINLSDQQPVSWIPLLTCLASCKALNSLALESIRIVSPLRSKEPGKELASEKDKVAAISSASLCGGLAFYPWSIPTMRTFSFKNCVALPNIKISIVLAFPNLEELAVSSIQDLWESGGEFETILGRDYPFTKLKLLEVVDIRGPQWKEVSNWDTACTWIKRGVKPKNRDEKEAVTNAHATLNQGQQLQQQQEQLTEGGVVLCTEFSYPYGQYLSQEGIRVRHVRMRPSNNVRIETLWLPCCRQLETLSLSTAGRAHFPSHLLSVGMKLDRPLNQDTVIKHLPWMETLTSLHLRGRGNESPVWTKWMREILLMMKALNDFMLLEPMSDLALFEGMGRDRVRMIELGQGQDLTQETEGQLHGDERDMRFERPFLKRLTIRRASSATSTIAQWEDTLWRKFRFLEVMDVDDQSNADVA